MDGRPIGAWVALESTLIAHGLPRPDNFATAVEAEEAVRSAGAGPRTIAVVKGEVRVGLDREAIRRLAEAPDGSVVKAGRRDLAAAVARRLDAATTVSATLWLARRGGPVVMATGGLGGVHRGAGLTFDVSSDLDELASADGSVVVCSGVKSILDIPATLEVLETRGVAVVGYRTDEFPGFTAASSGLRVEVRAETPGEVAAIVRAHRRLGLPGAIVVAQPAPAALAVPRAEIEAAMADALRHAEVRGVVGKAITPFLLDAVRVATGGKTLVANRALIVANAGLAGAIAVALAGDPGPA